MKNFMTRWILLALILIIFLVIWFLTPLHRILDLNLVFENRAVLLDKVHHNYGWAVLVYIGIYIMVTGLSIPGATILTLLGGFFFGPWLATLYINIGASTGAFLIFLASRYFFGEAIQKKYAKKLLTFNREIKENGRNYMLILRLVPLFPFFLVNLFAGLSPIAARQFFWTTSLGIIPGSFTYAWLGYAGATLGEGPPWQIFVALGLLALLSLIPVFLRKAKKIKRKKNDKKDEGRSKT